MAAWLSGGGSHPGGALDDPVAVAGDLLAALADTLDPARSGPAQAVRQVEDRLMLGAPLPPPRQVLRHEHLAPSVCTALAWAAVRAALTGDHTAAATLTRTIPEAITAGALTILTRRPPVTDRT